VRADGPLVVVDCGAIPANLIESELFGHEKGAFTGADRRHVGAFEEASGGTLFLDEIGELPLELQPRLLRAVEAREIRRVGSQRPIDVDVRIVAATHRDLKKEVNARRFRADLYYRLAVTEVVLPPLRERPEDLPLLVEALLAGDGRADTPAGRRLRDPAWLEDLGRHDWPGNVRELRNHVERCLAMGELLALGGTERVAAAARRAAKHPSVPGQPAAETTPEVALDQPLRVVREAWIRHVERRYLEGILAAHGHNVSAAARAAGIDRIHFYRLLKSCGLR
jgi:DNA-binding NtrC family response regulator